MPKVAAVDSECVSCSFLSGIVSLPGWDRVFGD